ncbi:hypothetical protein [Bdellovibrio sp. NC01]|uniref:hypothetical protein n=1 Tax=Bdellovibrio sp. NC01 TaxID=2220073 RepID=UPI001159F1BE|nr:hypothetical protein [Bdellovibrio sp. NC01]QDK36189.1 hypothetical protein DOE51_00510 [Bdellovibrio sp. NC01]
MKFVLLLSMLFASQSFAGILSVSSKEVRFNYKAEFQTSQTEEDAVNLSYSHAQHLFGYLQSPSVTGSFGIDSQTLGIGAPKMPLNFQIISDKKTKGVRTISYKVSGLMILNKLAEAQLTEQKEWHITLPYDLDNFYAEKCTDEHYSSFGDFWYFYDPFRKGCGFLQQEPMAKQVVVKIAPVAKVEDTSAHFADLRGDNGNGDLFDIATINGFSDSAKDSEDIGRQNWEEGNEWLRSLGFQERMVAKYQNRPVIEFTKDLKKADGKIIKVRVTRLLAETGIEYKNVTFAKFFKNALEKADVVIYEGHSGLGGNLDIPALEEKAGKITFDPKKRQLFFFDSCSSYSYYLSTFEAQKSKGKIDILTQGLQSYFWAELPSLKVLFMYLLSPNKDPQWSEVLRAMEKVLEGQTQMLSVGSI